MRKFLHLIDDNFLGILSAFLIVFIPLYPKLPLLDALPGYIVRIRLEDFAVAFTIFFWLIWLIRGKISIRNNPLLKPIGAYLLVGLLSVLTAIFVIKTVPMQSLHIDKILLHYLRRIEYFSLFFILYSTVRSLKQVKIYIVLTIMTILAVALYGFGQKYLYWPAFSTMNREFSKGWVLYLTQHARVLSTFGGHYDLAAFIMMALILLWSLFFGVRKIFWKIILLFVIACAFWTLILTASRTSFLAYLFGITLMFFLWAFKKGLSWSVSRWLIVTVLSIVIMLSFGDLSERFTKLLKIDQRLSGLKSLVMLPIAAPPGNKAVFLENNPDAAIAQITEKSDQPPTPLHPTPALPSDVLKNIPLVVPVGTGTATVQRTYSQTAYMYDLSTAIRLDALWPMAIKGFKRDPLLGSGYSTLNKSQVTDFTEAESTDNDYLRSLGETGILGFVTFFGTLLLIIYIVWRNLPAIRDPILISSAAGLGGLAGGLLINASYIDVFESSKVAYSFWALTGFILAGVTIAGKDRKTPVPVIPDLKPIIQSVSMKILKFLKSDLFFLLIILSIALILRLYKINNPLADWHSWRQADTSAVSRNYVKHGVNLLYPTYDDLSNVASGKDNPKGLRFVEFPLYNLATIVVDRIVIGYNIEVSGRLTSVFATLGSIIFLFLIVRKYLGRKEAVIAASFYSINPYNIYFTRVILPEPFLVFTSLGMIYFLDKWLSKITAFPANSGISEKVKSVLLFLTSLVFTMSAVLVKPTAAFLFLPMVYLWLKYFGISLKSIIYFIFFWAISLLPFILWRNWISHFPEGIPAYTWLLNGDGIRFKGAFFYWLFADRLAREILGYWSLPFLVLGIISPGKKESWLFYWWGIGILLYVTVIATGNIRHDYYQVFTIPIISIFVAKGIAFLVETGGKSLNRFSTVVMVIIALIFTEMFGWYYIRDYYNINHPEIVEAGRALERLSPPNALVIAPYNGDTAFLYQTNRAGWPVLQDPIDKMIKRGADYYVTTTFDDTTKELIKNATDPNPLKRTYKLIKLTDSYAIIQLVPDSSLPL